MFVLGHAGIGSCLARPFLGKQFHRRPVYFALLLGTLLPDIIDKSLFYGFSFAIVTGTRTFAHSLLFVLIVFVISFVRRSLVWRALALGLMSHLLMDHTIEYFVHGGLDFPNVADEFSFQSRRMTGLFWPLFGNRFPIYPYDDLKDHFLSIKKAHILLGEILGFFILLRERRTMVRDLPKAGVLAVQ